MPFSLSACSSTPTNWPSLDVGRRDQHAERSRLCTVSNGNVYIHGVLTGTDGLTKDGKGILCLNAPTNLFSGKVQALNGDLFAETDRSLGLVPAVFEPDALVLDGGSLGNYTGLLTCIPTAASRPAHPAPTVRPECRRRHRSGRADHGCRPLLIVQESAAVTLANPANDYAGGTVVGAAGPGIYASTWAQATLRLGANEVIPHGAGKGALTLNGQRKGVLDLNGHSETSTAVP
jgi:hypothetical protein